MAREDGPRRATIGAWSPVLRALPFLAPWAVGFLALVAWPFAASLWWSFTRYDLLSPPRWVGWRNYQRLGEELWSGGPFGRALWNTAYYAAVSVPLSVALGVALAALLAQGVRGVGVYRTLWYLPSVVPVVATAILWIALLDPQAGLANAALSTLGAPEQGWLNSTSEALWPPSWPPGAAGRVFGSKDALVLMSLWGVGNFVVIYLAAIGDIPESLYEAARLDGAGPLRRFAMITLPMLSPVIFFNVVMGLIQAVQAFAQVYLVSDGVGDPAGSTLMLSLHLFLAAFRDLEVGYASAMAWALFVIVLGVTAWLFGTSRRWVFYRG
ncbi:sugar ABC transporter permease [Botrimarina sp.]|uniref:carbohydrate ABC transporter permease n=1 Tax=Botrimarina sp. TaxID=2795802 RepID=UPI0032ED76F2